MVCFVPFAPLSGKTLSAFRFPILKFFMDPHLIPGGRKVDARGSVSFVNGFDFKGVDRFYWIEANQPNTPRGWVGHQREHKWFSVIRGEVLVAVVAPDNWCSREPENGRADLPVGPDAQQHVPTADQGRAARIVSEKSNPSRNLSVARFTLTSANPQVLHVPPGHATGSVHLTAEAILMIFSSGKIEDAPSDDFRFPADYWPILLENKS